MAVLQAFYCKNGSLDFFINFLMHLLDFRAIMIVKKWQEVSKGNFRNGPGALRRALREVFYGKLNFIRI